MVEIRTLTRQEHFSDLLWLSREFFSEYEAYHDEFFKIDQLADEDILDYFYSFCDSPTRRAYIAVEDGRMVGYITVYVKEQAAYWQVKQVGEISGLMVKKEHRHKGIAGKLIAEAASFFRSLKIKYYLVYTSVENKTALRFYEQNGLSRLYTTMIGET